MFGLFLYSLFVDQPGLKISCTKAQTIDFDYLFLFAHLVHHLWAGPSAGPPSLSCSSRRCWRRVPSWRDRAWASPSEESVNGSQAQLIHKEIFLQVDNGGR